MDQTALEWQIGDSVIVDGKYTGVVRALSGQRNHYRQYQGLDLVVPLGYLVVEFESNEIFGAFTHVVHMHRVEKVVGVPDSAPLDPVAAGALLHRQTVDLAAVLPPQQILQAYSLRIIPCYEDNAAQKANRLAAHFHSEYCYGGTVCLTIAKQ